MKAYRKATTSRRFILALSAMVLMGAPSSVRAGLLFFDDFESTLAQWTGKLAGPHHGQIVGDPIEPDQALNFTQLNAAGDIFTAGAFSSPTQKYRLSFDYLGDPTLGGVAGNLGGFIGHSFGLPAGHTWLAGTSGASGAAPILVDDGAWHHYTIDFMTPGSIHVMIEDFSGSRGVAGDAYFDNVRLESIPEPATVFLLAVGLFAAGLRRRRP